MKEGRIPAGQRQCPTGEREQRSVKQRLNCDDWQIIAGLCVLRGVCCGVRCARGIFLLSAELKNPCIGSPCGLSRGCGEMMCQSEFSRLIPQRLTQIASLSQPSGSTRSQIFCVHPRQWHRHSSPDFNRLNSEICDSCRSRLSLMIASPKRGRLAWSTQMIPSRRR